VDIEDVRHVVQRRQGHAAANEQFDVIYGLIVVHRPLQQCYPRRRHAKNRDHRGWRFSRRAPAVTQDE
jgi:hypothetical protein